MSEWDMLEQDEIESIIKDLTGSINPVMVDGE